MSAGTTRPIQAEPPCTFASRGQNGLHIVNGPLAAEPKFQRSPLLDGAETVQCRNFCFSDDGFFFAYHSGPNINVINTETGKQLFSVEMPRTQFMCFSPKGTILCLWEQFYIAAKDPKGDPNMTLWNVETGEKVAEYVHKKQHNWEPVWTVNEEVCCRSTSSYELNFFEKNEFETTSAKLHIQKTVDFAITPHIYPPNVASYVPGTKGSPSFVRLYKYPNLTGQSSALAQKSFFRADSVDMKWNRRGTALLILTSVEISNDSYMGEQALHYVATNSESCNVDLDKKGPVYSVSWSPTSTEFCVVYGLMPAKAKLFNHKAEPLFDFGTGPRNTCVFNAHGNILLVAGFGNLRGSMEFWDVRKKTLIASSSAADSTLHEWAPDGVHLLTATTSPRLRVGNGYKIWHYDGTCVYQETLKDKEIWDIKWRPARSNTYKEKSIKYPSGAAKAAAAEPVVKAYRPPMAQGRECAFKLHDDEDIVPAGGHKAADAKLSKNAKKREAKKARKAAEDGTENEVKTNGASSSAPSMVAPQKEQSPLMGPAVLTGDPETDKRIKNLQKKLREIHGLKKAKSEGKKLELNQTAKLDKEDELTNELKSLCLK